MLIMNDHAFKTSCTLCIGGELCALPVATNLMDQHTVPAQQNNREVFGHRSLVWKTCKDNVLLFKSKKSTLFETYYGKI